MVAPVPCQHPALSQGMGMSGGVGWGGGRRRGRAAKPWHHHLTSIRGLPGTGTGCQVPCHMPAPLPRATCLPLGPCLRLVLHPRSPACASLGTRSPAVHLAPRWQSLATLCRGWRGHRAIPGAGAVSWLATPWAPERCGGLCLAAGPGEHSPPGTDKGPFVPAAVGLALRGGERPLLPTAACRRGGQGRDGCWVVQGGGWADPEVGAGPRRDGCQAHEGTGAGLARVSEPGRASGTGLGEGEAWRGVCPAQGIVPGSGG